MSHRLHPAADARHLLDPECPDCISKKLGDLDDEYLHALTRWVRSDFENLPPELERLLMQTSALDAQRERLAITHEPWPFDPEDPDTGSDWPIQDTPEEQRQDALGTP